MPYYADIAAVRIQSWLARTPKLKGRRGASILLREATDAKAVEHAGILPAGVHINTAAGNVDGVVNLQADTPDAAAAGADAVLARLRERLPALELQAVVSDEWPDYFLAYPQMKLALAAGDGIEWQPAVPEVPMAQPCTYCGQDPVALTRTLSPDADQRDQGVCRDCAARLDAAGRTADARRVPDVIQRVSEWLEASIPGDVELTFPQDFGALAAMGQQTHLATVFIDGNRVGALFEALANSTTTTASGQSAAPTKESLAHGIDAATQEALVTGLLAVTGHSEQGEAQLTVPALPHLVGGDDLLITVGAAEGWTFTRAFLDRFEQVLAQWVASNKLTVNGPTPTAAAGMVIHHKNHPFAVTVASADEALSAAKQGTKGDEGAIAWVDVSATGPAVAGPVRSTWLTANDAALAALARVPASQRAVLTRTPVPELPDQVRRMGLASSAGPLLRQGAGVLQDSLAVVRWWRHD